MAETSVSQETLLELKGVHKWFGRVHALQGVDFEIAPGEVVGLCGDNGAGKSTLIKVVSGYHVADEGEIFWQGQPVRLTSPHQARQLGIETVYQEQALAPHLSIARNIFMGREPTNALGLMDRKAMADLAMNQPAAFKSVIAQAKAAA